MIKTRVCAPALPCTAMGSHGMNPRLSASSRSMCVATFLFSYTNWKKGDWTELCLVFLSFSGANSYSSRVRVGGKRGGSVVEQARQGCRGAEVRCRGQGPQLSPWLPPTQHTVSPTRPSPHDCTTWPLGAKPPLLIMCLVWKQYHLQE